MAYRKKAYRRVLRYRGGYRIPGGLKGIGTSIAKGAGFAFRNRREIAQQAEQLFPGITGSLSALGAEAMRHALVKIAPTGKPTALPLVPNNALPSVSQGEVSMTKYVAKHKCPKTNMAIKRVLSMAQRLEMSYVTGYRLTNTVGSTQVFGDMSNSSSQSNSTASISASAIHCIAGGNYYDTTNANVPGMLNLLTANIHANVNQARTQTTKFFLTSCTVDTEIANVSSYPIVVDIYEVLAKEDLLGAGTTNNYGPYGVYVYSPIQFWSSGLGTNTSPIVGSSLGPTNTTARPYDNDLFSNYWRICSKLTIALSTGDVHRHSSVYQYNKVIQMTKANYSTLLRNVTRNIMIVARGTTVQDSGVSPAVSVTGPGTINVTHQVHYKYMALPFSAATDAYFTLNKSLTTPYRTLDNGWTVDSTLNPL